VSFRQSFSLPLSADRLEQVIQSRLLINNVIPAIRCGGFSMNLPIVDSRFKHAGMTIIKLEY